MNKSLLWIIALITIGSLLTGCSSDGRYQISRSNTGSHTIKIDTKTGDTWQWDDEEWRPILDSDTPLNK